MRRIYRAGGKEKAQEHMRKHGSESMAAAFHAWAEMHPHEVMALAEAAPRSSHAA
jgi:hypothetical protein